MTKKKRHVFIEIWFNICWSCTNRSVITRTIMIRFYMTNTCLCPHYAIKPKKNYSFLYCIRIISVIYSHCFHLLISKTIGQISSPIGLHGHLWWDIYQEMSLKDHRIVYRFISLIDRFDNGLFYRQINHIMPSIVRNRHLECRSPYVFKFINR